MSPAGEGTRKVVVGDDGGGRRLDVYLANRFPAFSRSRIRKLIEAGNIESELRRLKPATVLTTGEALFITAPGIGAAGPAPPLPPVLFEDERLLVVSKPAGMLAHPTGLMFTHALVGIARAARPDDAIDLAHRLDRDTSGISVLTKDMAANAFLKAAFHDKRPNKTYHAIVHGSPDWETQLVNAPIGRSSNSAIRIRRGIEPMGLEAITRVEVLKRMEKHTLVAAHPQTGRTHQIRVHLESLGLPILGDKMYGQPDSTFLHLLDKGPDAQVRAATGFPRHALHAARLEIPHPDGGSIEFEAPLAEDMVAVVSGTSPCWPAPEA